MTLPRVSYLSSLLKRLLPYPSDRLPVTDDAILSDRPGAIEGLPPRPSVPRDWLMSDLTDSLEEEAELTDDTFLSEGVAELYRQAHPDSIGNKAYFDSLFALQAELIKLSLIHI